MRWYLDTEFNEDGRTIELISIGLSCDDGREYYAVSADFDADACNDWVKCNVLPKIEGYPVKPRHQIKNEILALIPPETEPEFWGYFADYDWVVFCQLFGRMIDLPKGYPMACMDLRQELVRLGIKRTSLPSLDAREAHTAIADARWNRRVMQMVSQHAA